MKQQLLIAGILVVMLASCKKDRTCECTQTHTNAVGTSTYAPVTTTYKKITKAEAKSMCQKKTSSYHSVVNYASGGTSITDYSDTYDCKT